MPRVGKGLLVVVLLFAPACRSISRDVNSALPAIFRSEPGEEELERLAVLKRGRVEMTPEERAARQALVEEAKAVYAAGDFDSAADLFEDFLDEYPGTEFDEECRFLWGEAHYRDGSFAAAYGAFKSYAVNFPVSSRAALIEERLYDIGRDYLDGNQSALFGIFSNRSKGLEILNHLVETYPNAERADDAKWTVARYFVDDEDWEKAIPTFDFLVLQYKNSEWFPAAKWFAAYCRYRRVKGDFYDPIVVEDARRGFAEYVKDYPAGEWRPQAESIIAELDASAAERMVQIGEWYIDQDKPYSARFYVLRVKQDWPGSEAAKRAEALYAEVALAEPETPEEELRLQEEFSRRALPSGPVVTPPSAPESAPTVPVPAVPESMPASRESK